MSKMKRLLIDMVEAHLPDDEEQELDLDHVLLDNDLEFIPHDGKLCFKNGQEELGYEWY